MLKPRQLTFVLCALLLVKTCRALAQDDDVMYRHEFYREDNNRMSVDTDAAHFDLTISPNVRLTGDLVLDAISGASPNGAPPQSKWPFASFAQDVASYYNIVYNNPNNLILFQSGYFNTYADYTNYVVANNPGIGAAATNYANQVYGQLAGSPSFHNTKVPVVEVHDRRKSISVGLPLTFGNHEITPEFSESKEHDYHSYGFALKYAVQLYNKNTTLNAGWSHNSDRVLDNTLANWQGKASDDVIIGITQLVTPKSYFTVDLTLGVENGYLSDPYRGVITLLNLPQPNPEDAVLISENRPRHKLKETFYTSFTQFVDPLNGSAELGYRFYHDSYGIFANTAELAWHQKIGRHLVLTPAIRYYNQTAANFYAEIFPDAFNLPAYYSSDYRLTQLQSFNLSVSLNYRIQKHVSIDVAYARYIMQGLDGVTDQSAYPSANVYSIGGRIHF